MKLKNKLILLGILMGVISFSGLNSSMAADITSVFDGETINRQTIGALAKTSEINSSKELGISKDRESRNWYVINPTTDAFNEDGELNFYANGNAKAQRIWKIAEYSSGVRNYSNLYYCLNIERGFGINDGDMAEGRTDKYPNSFDMKNNNKKSTITELTGGSLGTNYNKVLWILDNSYIPTGTTNYQTTPEYKRLMEAAGINDSKIYLTEDDIEVVQQIAIWYFTNPNTIIKEGEGFPSLYLNGEQLSQYTNGRARQNQAASLYNYFITNASESYISTNAIPTLSLSNENVKVTESGDNYIVGPFSLKGTNIGLIKRIEANVNVDYKLLKAQNTSKIEVSDKDFKKVIGSAFYLEIPKNKITQSTDIDINLTYKYDTKKLTVLTDKDDSVNTQTVVLVENEEKAPSINTNSAIELINIPVEKVWNDNENQDGKRASSVIVNLLANGVKIKDVRLSASNGWEYEFEKLLKNKDGNTITYTVTENTVSNYATSIDGNENDGFVITNTHIPEIITISGTKTWQDNENQDGKRPESITVNLLENGTEIKDVKVTAANDWKYSFTDLPKYKNGAEIEYRITEDAVAEYTTTIKNYDITNKYTPSKVSKTVIKNWEDADDADKLRPEKITVELYKVVDGQEIKIERRDLDKENDWKYTWNDLDEKANGEKIVYGIKEIDSIDGYTTVYSEDDDSNTTTITNTHVSKNLAVQIQKVDEQGNIITSSEAEFEVTGEQTLTDETIQGKLDLKAKKILNNLEYIYRIKETKAPIGYNGISEELSVKISGTTKSENGSYVIDTINFTDKDGKQLDSSKISAEYSEELNKVIIKIINTKVTNEYSVKLLKVDEDGETPIEGAWFRVNEGQPIQVATTGNEIGAGTLSDESELELVYKLEETIAPDGYIKINGQKEVRIRAEVELQDNIYQIKDVNLEEDLEGIGVSVNNNVITIKVENKPIITGKYNIVLRKVDANGDKLLGSKFKVSGTEYDLSTTGEVVIYENEEIKTDRDIDFMYMLEEILVPTGYNGIETTEVNIKAQVQKVDNNYKIIRATLVDGEGNNITDDNISIKLEGESIVIEVKNTPIEKEFDLSLRKFITKINDQTYSREPVVDTSTIATTGTATYKHSKQPIAVQKGDIVTYTIRVYNEGEIAGYVDKITDYLPNYLLPILSTIDGIDTKKYENEIKFNEAWLWMYEENTLTTTITSKLNTETYAILTGLENVEDTELEAYVEGSNKLDYIDVQIKCLVSDSAIGGQYLTNIAEITDAQDINKAKGDGFDSELNNVDHSNLSDYKNNEAINSTTESYVPGQEDDDDFEKLVVKEFDLSLRKFITKVNETTHSREPQVYASKLGTIVNGKTVTTATYVHTKEPVIVETSDLVTYKIRIYNEGTIAGFANEITDDIPAGLEFLPNSDINVSYRWKMLDKDGKETEDVTKAVMITTDYLSDRDSNNIIREVAEVEGTKTLSYKDVEVQFKVIAKAEKLKDNIIINEAQISADSDRDIDSEPNRDEKYDYTTGKNEDDIDYEPIKLQYFDLALRKFITKVNNTDYNNRYPEIKFNENGSITYNHTKDPVIVTTGDTVIYTIRVYNEGKKAGYATEIKDNLPEGLAFDPQNETNKLYGWKMIDKEGNVTEEVEKVVAFKTNYLENEKIDSLVEVNGSKVLSYKDVQIAFIVTESNTSDKILVNTAQISADSDEDIDSIPDNSVESEDDIDKEYVKVQYFDLALKKWVTETRVTLDGKTTTTKTEFDEDSDGIAKVDIVAKKLKKTTVKFVYNIKVTNEGELPGYANEIKDYIPNGLKFVAEDNKNWKEVKGNVVVTDQLKDTLLNPGESATVEIVLTWKNSSTNLGVKTNYAEISVDSAEDIDSIPDNYDFTEDDIDDAKVILSIKTAGANTYIGLVLISVAVLAGGIFLIKRYVLD